MPGPVEHRTVTPLLNYVRKILRGADHTNGLRFADKLVARNQPPPTIPGGPYHRTSKIYYYTRDARREVTPPEILATNTKQLTAGGGAVTEPKLATPGKVWHWD